MNLYINWLDVLIILGLNTGMFLGFWQGGLRQALGLGAVFVSIIASSRLYPYLAQYVMQLQPRMVATVADVVSFVVMQFVLGFVVTFILMDLLRDVTSRPIGGTSRVAGAIIGLVSAGIIVTVSLVALKFMLIGVWPASSEPYRQALADARTQSNLVVAFQLFWPPLLQVFRIGGGVLPSIFSVSMTTP